MKKNRWLAGLLLILFIIGLVLGIWQFYFRKPEKPDFAKMGGTILVYEIDDGNADLTDSMAKALEKRLDFAWVKALDKGQFEIRIPRIGKKHPDDVVRIKELAAMVGHLEFRILANGSVDQNAMDDAWDMLNKRTETDAALQVELKERQDKGLPPPPLQLMGEKETTTYEISMPNGQSCKVTYSWVELGRHEREILGLYQGGKENPDAEKTWQHMKKNCGRAFWLKDPFSKSRRFLLNGALFYSRACTNRNIKDEDRKKKAIDFFVLVRDPELEQNLPADLPIQKRRTPQIDGKYLTSAYARKWDDSLFPNRWRLDLTFNPTGTELLRLITLKNAPRAEAKLSLDLNHLGILLDDQILAAPTINSEIRDGRCMIDGRFTEQEMKNLARVLNSGPLPARLKPQPVSETTVEPNK
jgi:hypothetical protein